MGIGGGPGGMFMNCGGGGGIGWPPGGGGGTPKINKHEINYKQEIETRELFYSEDTPRLALINI